MTNNDDGRAPPRIRKRLPPPMALTILHGSAPVRRSRSLTGVGSDLETEWIAFGEASEVLRAALPSLDVEGADHAIRQRIYKGLVPVSCEDLTYQHFDTNQLESISWPDAQAALGKQLMLASSNALSRFRFFRDVGDAMWTDLIGGVHVNVSGLVVDRHAVAAITATRARVRGAAPSPSRISPTAAALDEWARSVGNVPRDQITRAFIDQKWGKDGGLVRPSIHEAREALNRAHGKRGRGRERKSK